MKQKAPFPVILLNSAEDAIILKAEFFWVGAVHDFRLVVLQRLWKRDAASLILFYLFAVYCAVTHPQPQTTLRRGKLSDLLCRTYTIVSRELINLQHDSSIHVPNQHLLEKPFTNAYHKLFYMNNVTGYMASCHFITIILKFFFL